jgi:radical SAM-linked protein
MTEGFHPKPKLTFPSALALGIVGNDEVMEFELSEAIPPEELRERLESCAPPDGLSLLSLRELGAGEAKARVRAMRYAIPIPAERREAVERELRNWKESTSYLVLREGREEPVDVKAGVDQLDTHEGQLRFRLIASSSGCSVRPREVLQSLGLDGLEAEGLFLTREAVEVAP